MKEAPRLLAHAESLRAQRTPFVLATVVRAQRPTSARPGDRALVLADGTIEGFVGGTCAESTVRVAGMRSLTSGESTLLRITPEAEGETAGEGVLTVGNPCLSGGSLEIFLEPQLPSLLVEVFGAAPIARALEEVGAALGYEVRRNDDSVPALPADTAAVVVASHGRGEDDALRAALRAGVDYIGLIASPRRGRAVLAALDEPDAARVHTPAGLDIGARTPEEIALSVYAQLLAERPRPSAGEPEVSAGVAEATDPVCGMSVAITATTPQAGHDGRRYYFCGPGCGQAFADDPSRYLPTSPG
ncbi:xanthine and CO dehydrogenases maturation factor, XdhC/CoxF family [Saccharomonospora marina XMU15]|uniref:Xanthine and CO dehydrogenases maturation factor, XdhC/CoxF family n=1 Tax=Saccharomonospora marina XMU15 TaxID=882083 RepID=H5X876_9PSEU|nr:XdhC family protein [Saccharomonospora marina]EHR49107.1 xanthine and CO dehydrogenases maturation factor, XdhC/CoxF family [Saccharomonospora marina XMU15]